MCIIVFKRHTQYTELIDKAKSIPETPYYPESESELL